MVQLCNCKGPGKRKQTYGPLLEPGISICISEPKIVPVYETLELGSLQNWHDESFRKA